jgi:hypothetical protein
VAMRRRVLIVALPMCGRKVVFGTVSRSG